MLLYSYKQCQCLQKSIWISQGSTVLNGFANFAVLIGVVTERMSSPFNYSLAPVMRDFELVVVDIVSLDQTEQGISSSYLY